MFYRATLLDLDYSAGIESLEVEMFTETQIPWEDIAFPTVAYTLRTFFDDLQAGEEKWLRLQASYGRHLQADA